MNKTNSNLDTLLKVSDVAKQLNISRSGAYQLVQSGEIPVIRIHRSIRIRQVDLNEYVMKCWTGWSDH